MTVEQFLQGYPSQEECQGWLDAEKQHPAHGALAVIRVKKYLMKIKGK